ncbi:hypothetical protein SPSYN_01219 [Sporotomaculum syntrophicum]|uniref:Uncharacterized protein n=1 Tax=Sporotomaculum syntrophicum TaxID=182264 RepID=A0A9D2WQ76_9FIRM|nr:hypothetical protein [Sporotomaculum syntrophicum]KAF1085083.1 hypothetical protein SPSYN_01219 [Sporotomaculum syntrophicum]
MPLVPGVYSPGMRGFGFFVAYDLPWFSFAVELADRLFMEGSVPEGSASIARDWTKRYRPPGLKRRRLHRGDKRPKRIGSTLGKYQRVLFILRGFSVSTGGEINLRK